jgi:hypothetical protein
MKRDATFSVDPATYRYDLIRTWGVGDVALWVMLNPSTADGKQDDPTIRRCIGFTKEWGLEGLVVVNQYAFRAKDPKQLNAVFDPRGPQNENWIARWLGDGRVRFVVAAWGSFKARRPMLSIAPACLAAGKPLYCLGVNQDGSPKHPLYVPAKTPLRQWPVE